MDFLLYHKKASLAVFIILILSIPSLAFLIKQRTSFGSKASQGYDRTITKESTSSAKEVSKTLSLDSLDQAKSTPAPSSSGGVEGSTAQLTFGPTLNFQIVIQGRPTDNQSMNDLFVGIASGNSKSNPQYLLSFTLKVPNSGIYTGLSLAGLTIGDTYTAYLKGPVQIASSSAFVMAPNITALNSGSPLTLQTGDLNQDNVINSLDYTIAKNNFGKTSKSPDWNPNIDFNLDNVINTWDLAIILSNMNRTGAGDLYTSHVASASAKPATSSGLLRTPSIGGPGGGSPQGGYWMWVPNF